MAFQSLFSYDLAGAGVDELLEFPWLDETRRTNLKSETLDFARLIVRGTLESLPQIDASIKKHLEHWDFTRLNKVDLAILRISVYCLLFQKDIPATVTIDEAIDIAKEYGTDDSYRFINGVMDGIRKHL